jgi:hypothetical protein
MEMSRRLENIERYINNFKKHSLIYSFLYFPLQFPGHNAEQNEPGHGGDSAVLPVTTPNNAQQARTRRRDDNNNNNSDDDGTAFNFLRFLLRILVPQVGGAFPEGNRHIR